MAFEGGYGRRESPDHHWKIGEKVTVPGVVSSCAQTTMYEGEEGGVVDICAGERCSDSPAKERRGDLSIMKPTLGWTKEVGRRRRRVEVEAMMLIVEEE